MPRTRFAIFIITAIFMMVTAISAISADEIVMKSGERFSSDHIWEENGKIRFDMQGLMVNVNKEDVTAIIREADLPDNLTPRGAVPNSPQKPPIAGDGPGVYRKTRSLKHRNLPEHGTGLENISWRMNPNRIDGVTKIKTDPSFGGIDQYWRPDQPLSFGDAPLDGLVYGFWQNQLYTIVMWVDGTIGFRRLKEAVFALYGPVSQNRSDMERYIWLENETQRMLEFDTDLNTGLFVMRSAELDTLIKKRYPPDRNLP